MEGWWLDCGKNDKMHGKGMSASRQILWRKGRSMDGRRRDIYTLTYTQLLTLLYKAFDIGFYAPERGSAAGWQEISAELG